MSNVRLMRFAFGVAVAVAWGGLACSASDVRFAPDAGPADAQPVVPSNDASFARDAVSDAASVQAFARFVHLSPDLGPVDVCYRSASGGAWVGPLLAQSAAAKDEEGDPPPTKGIAFSEATGYVWTTAPGTFDVALVAAGSASCTYPLGIFGVTLDARRPSTLVIMGSSNAQRGSPSALQVATLHDDVTTEQGLARARFVHAAVASTFSYPYPTDGGDEPAMGALSVALVSGEQVTQPLTCAVDPGDVASPCDDPVVDALGYTSTNAVSEDVAIHFEEIDTVEGRHWATEPADWGLTAGSVHTGFMTVDASGACWILWCDDLHAEDSYTACQRIRAL